MALVGYGAQDVYLTGNRPITFFRTRYLAGGGGIDREVWDKLVIIRRKMAARIILTAFRNYKQSRIMRNAAAKIIQEAWLSSSYKPGGGMYRRVETRFESFLLDGYEHRV